MFKQLQIIFLSITLLTSFGAFFLAAFLPAPAASAAAVAPRSSELAGGGQAVF